MSKNVYIVSLGCSKNRVDTEVLLSILSGCGFTAVSDPAEADAAFVNTCGFIESAKEESIEAIFEMSKYKKTGRLKKLFVTGCLSQRYPDALYAEMPEVDGFLGVSEYSKTAEMLSRSLAGERPIYVGNGERFLKCGRVLTTSAHSAYVKISDGCDNRCTYCAIPLIRGTYSSRPYDDIISECRFLADSGVTELTFIAQDTSRYGNDFAEKTLLLPKLLNEATKIDGVRWVRALYCYPDTVTDELLNEIAENAKICPYIDLPLQHINDNILSRMNRRGDSKHIRALIKKCRERGVLLRTTFIVGFPGETDSQFNELLDFVNDAKFERMGAFAYSPEEGTKACDMPDQVDDNIKRERLDALMTAQMRVSHEYNLNRLGTEVEVLAEGLSDDSALYVGRSALEAPEVDGVIRFSADRRVNAGEYVRVRLTDCDAYDMTGVMVSK